MIALDDYISGEKFIDLADFVFAPNRGNDYNKIKHTFNKAALFNKAIIYTHTMYIKELFEEIKNSPWELIIISHNSDTNVDDSFIIPDNVCKWYSTNMNIIDERCTPLPIGLENKRWMIKVNKIEIMKKKYFENISFKNLIYVNHSISTNPAVRQKPYDYFKQFNWCTIEHGKNGQDFENYILNIKAHPFVICPEGNGIDTHRFWETLYMDRFPIVLFNNLYSKFTCLPFLGVNKWEAITEHRLNKNLGLDIANTYKNLLTMKYWKTKILQR